MQSMNVNELDQLLCDSFRQLYYIKAITPITLTECQEVVQDEVNSSISRKIPTIEAEALAKLLFIIFEALDKGMTMEQIAKSFCILKKELRRQDAIKRTLASAAEELDMPEMLEWMPKSLVCLEGGRK
jgi:hypothetical protein